MLPIHRAGAVVAVAVLSALGGAAFSSGSADPAAVATAAVETPSGVPAGAQRGVVERIVDGDTISVRIDDPGGPLVAAASHTIRLLQIDTPETVHPSQPVQCGGPEATRFAEERLPVGATVWLEADRGDTDRYGRFLRHVYDADGVSFNELALREGIARHRIYPPNNRYTDRLAAASAEAVAAARGLHGPPCGGGGGGTTTPTPAPAPGPATAAAVATSPGAGPAVCHPNYDPCLPIVEDLNCSAVDGPVRVLGADPYHLDGDGNGMGCQ